MARSIRHTPIISYGSCEPGSMRAWRRMSSKKFRAGAKRAIRKASADFEETNVMDPRSPNEVIERYTAPDDGRGYWADVEPRYLRK